MSRSLRFSRWALTLIVALVAVGMSVGSASAAPRGRPDSPPKDKPRLEYAYKLAQQRLQIQDLRLKRADDYAGKIDALVAKLKGKGQDTAKLEQAVAAFRSAMASAGQEWQTASDILTAHAGFDGQGKVTDATQAAATLKDAHSHMQQASKIGGGAYKDLRAAIVSYRKAHRAVVEPAAPPSP
jgi:uncharacterized protein YhaN